METLPRTQHPAIDLTESALLRNRARCMTKTDISINLLFDSSFNIRAPSVNVRDSLCDAINALYNNPAIWCMYYNLQWHLRTNRTWNEKLTIWRTNDRDKIEPNCFSSDSSQDALAVSKLIFFLSFFRFAVSSSMSLNAQSMYKGYERAFCVRMKSTLTKRGCHFKSSGYRVSETKKIKRKLFYDDSYQPQLFGLRSCDSRSGVRHLSKNKRLREKNPANEKLLENKFENWHEILGLNNCEQRRAQPNPTQIYDLRLSIHISLYTTLEAEAIISFCFAAKCHS